MDKREYYENIIESIIDVGQAPGVIKALSYGIKRMRWTVCISWATSSTAVPAPT